MNTLHLLVYNLAFTRFGIHTNLAFRNQRSDKYTGEFTYTVNRQSYNARQHVSQCIVWWLMNGRPGLTNNDGIDLAPDLQGGVAAAVDIGNLAQLCVLDDQIMILLKVLLQG